MTKLFDNIAPDALPEAQSLLGSVFKDYAKGQIIVLPNTKLTHFGLVEKGSVEILHTDADGNVVLMAKAVAGETFGESLYYLGQTEPIEIRALSETRIQWIDIKSLKLDTALADRLHQNFVNLLCERNLLLNKRIQILSQLTLRDKVLALLSQNNISHGATLNTQMTREQLSLYLGTNRSALSRELSHMQTDGIIKLEGNKIKFL